MGCLPSTTDCLSQLLFACLNYCLPVSTNTRGRTCRCVQLGFNNKEMLGMRAFVYGDDEKRIDRAPFFEKVKQMDNPDMVEECRKHTVLYAQESDAYDRYVSVCPVLLYVLSTTVCP